MDPLLVAGLGNPGGEYAATRHNVGFRVLDIVSVLAGCPLELHSGSFAAGCARGDLAGMVLMKPLTYMNSSGAAVARALEQFSVPPDRLLVVLDDIALPLGKLRMRPRGSGGGHNGLQSIIASLGTEEFSRLRCGIQGRALPDGAELPDFVLSTFTQEETQRMAGMFGRAAAAALVFALRGVQRAMNTCNSG